MHPVYEFVGNVAVSACADDVMSVVCEGVLGAAAASMEPVVDDIEIDDDDASWNL